MSQNSRNRYFSKTQQKKTAEAPQKQGSFSELTSTKLIHFHRNLKNGFSPISFFGNVLPYPGESSLKIKMVRMVHRNLFYNTELKISDPKSELWRKTEILRGWENSKFSCEVQYWTLEGVFKDRMIFKYILEYSQVILDPF